MFINRLAFIVIISFNCFGFINEYKAQKAFKAQKFDDALDNYQKLVIEEPDNIQNLYNIANVFYEKKDYEQAKNYYEKVCNSQINESQKEQATFNYANCFAQLNDLENALKQYENVLKINANNKRAKSNIEIIKKMLEL